MTNTELLEAKIRESGYKKSYIANYIGLKSVYALSQKIRNEHEFKSQEIKKLCELLGITSLIEKEAIFFC